MIQEAIYPHIVVPMDANFMIRSLAAVKKRRKHRDFLKRRRFDDDGSKKRGFNHIHTYIYRISFIYVYIYGFKGDIKASHKSSTCKMGRFIVGRLTFFDGTVNDFSGRFCRFMFFDPSQQRWEGGRFLFVTFSCLVPAFAVNVENAGVNLMDSWNPKQPFINGCFSWMIPNF